MKREFIKVIIAVLEITLIVFGIVFIINENTKVSEAPEKEENVIVDDRIFAKYYDKAEEKIQEMTTEEKICQLFLVRYQGEAEGIEILEKYNFGGYLFFEKDFTGKSEEDVKTEIAKLQENARIPLLIASDEEGGIVTRLSTNSNLTQERFKSPSELYELGGFDKIREDTIQKSNILYNLGINLNLAPIVDVSTNPNDYIYRRTLGKDVNLTSDYARVVIEAGKEGKVSYTLKHFPGYGSNQDTHNGISIDNRSYDEILTSSLQPFRVGIEAGAETVMVSHNIINSIDAENLASLSPKVHNVLRDELMFTGVIMTDALDMGAIASDNDAVVKAILAGNDLIIITDYASAVEKTKIAIEEGRISIEMLNERAKQIIAWKFYKGLCK